MPVFGGLSADTLTTVVENAPIVQATTGEAYFREGAPADAMFVLEGGRVTVVKSWAGETRRLAILERGDCFGEMGLIDLGPRSATVIALEPTKAIRIDMGLIQRFYETDLKQFTLIQMNICREMSRRLRAADELIFRVRMEAGHPAATQAKLSH
jgi:CRP-like cAMP-binding protein